MRMLPVLILVVLVKIYGLIKGASCPYETIAGSTFLGFKMKKLLDLETEVELCLTVVPLFYAVNDTEKTAFTEVNMGKLQHYCQQNFQDGSVSNLEVMHAANFQYGKTIPSRNITALTSDIYKAEYVGQTERPSVQFHGYRISFVNGTQKFNSEECVFDSQLNTFHCQLFDGIVKSADFVSKMIKDNKSYCTTIRVNDIDNFGQPRSVDMEPCETALQYQDMNFLCLHRPYDGCLYVKHRSVCLRDYRTGSCSRSVSYTILREPDLPYGRKCPENESFPCECRDENDDGEVYQEPGCYNGGSLVFDSLGIPYCECPFMLFGSKCQMIYGQHEVQMFFVMLTVFAVALCFVCFLRYLMQNGKCCFKVPNKRRRVRLPIVINGSLPLVLKNKKSAVVAGQRNK